MKIILVILINLVLIGGFVFYSIKSSNCPVINNTDRFNGSRHLYAGKMVLDINNPTINTEIKDNPSCRWNKILNKWRIT